MPLHIDYRPRELKQVVGNRATVAAIEAVLSRQRDWPRAWLFSGPSGCGKTTLARIVAARLGVAEMDLQELNIASFRGIDSARDIQDQVRLRPLGGAKRAWILDEVHMATKEFQNAMLKVLEDTPDHAFFLLCTTDPQKLLKTIVNRCHEFKVEALPEEALAALLNGVLRKEGASVPAEVVAQIAQDALGSARAALTALDKVIDMEPGEMLAAAKKASAEANETVELCRVLLRGGGWQKAAAILRGLGDVEPEQVRQAVLGYMSAVLLKEDSPRAWFVMAAMKEPLHYNGRPGLTLACYEAMQYTEKEPF